MVIQADEVPLEQGEGQLGDQDDQTGQMDQAKRFQVKEQCPYNQNSLQEANVESKEAKIWVNRKSGLTSQMFETEQSNWNYTYGKVQIMVQKIADKRFNLNFMMKYVQNIEKKTKQSMESTCEDR